jgi:ribonuclease-3
VRGTPNWPALERTLGVRLKNKSLLRQAFVHRSYLNEHPESGLESYERLEYLGDAFLGWVIADELYRRYPGYSEGDMTRARAALVRGTTLAEIARRLDAGSFLALGDGEEATGGCDRRSTLAAVVESILGAVLLDRGEKAARALVVRWLGDLLDALPESGGALRDAKSALQELVQRHGLPLPVYEVLDEEGPAHAKLFTVRVSVDGQALGEGEGRRKAEAEQSAAADARETLAARES